MTEQGWTYDEQTNAVRGPDNGNCMVRKCTPYGNTVEEIRKHGLLFAAAPAMYEALKEIVIADGCECMGDDNEPKGECLGCKGDAALAAADGRVSA